LFAPVFALSWPVARSKVPALEPTAAASPTFSLPSAEIGPMVTSRPVEVVGASVVDELPDKLPDELPDALPDTLPE